MKMYYTVIFTNLNHLKHFLRLCFLMIKVDLARFVIYSIGSINFKHFAFSSFEESDTNISVSFK